MTIRRLAVTGPVHCAAVGHLHKFAHDSGDGETIYHCPFCGSGQVIARSDRTIECEFCHVAFTVQVQPMFPAYPQTIDGQPVQVPGMPGPAQPPAPPGMEGPALDPEADPGQAPPGAPVDPGQIGEDGDVEGGDGDDDDEEEGSDDDDGKDGGKDGNPFAKKKSYRTASGQTVSEDDFVRHLAVVASGGDPAVLSRVRGSR